MKYDVHLYYAVRISVTDIEAESQEEAAEIAADEMPPLEEYLSSPVFPDESPYLGALVDEQGDFEYENTHYHEGPGARNYLKEQS